MARPPEVQGLLLCDEITCERSGAHFSFLRLMQARVFPTFPTPPQAFQAYAALYGGSGEGTIELACFRLETEEKVYRYQRWLAFSSHGLVVNLVIPVKKCVFPAPGRDDFRLFFERVELTHRFVEIVRTRT